MKLKSTLTVFLLMLAKCLLAQIDSLNLSHSELLKTASSTEQRCDSIEYYNWDENSDEWTITRMRKYTYDDSSNSTDMIVYLWDSSTEKYTASSKSTESYDSENNATEYISYTWNNTSKQFSSENCLRYTYDDNGNITSKTFLLPSGSTWIAQTKEETIYNDAGNIEWYASYQYDEENLQWMNIDKIKYEYNTDLKLSLKIYYTWDEENDKWIDYQKYDYTYDTDNNQYSAIHLSWDTSSSQYINLYKYEYYLNNDGYTTSYIYYDYDGTSSEWVRDRKREYEYDTYGNVSSDAIFYWSTNLNQWIGTSKYTYEWDEFGNNTLKAIYTWYDTDIWVEKNYKETTYNEYNNPDQSITYKWDSDTEDWINSKMITYYYPKELYTSAYQLHTNTVSLYPNPTTSNLTVTFTEATTATLELYNLQGAKVLSKQVNSNAPISLDDLEQGIYLYKLNINGQLQTGKVIKE